MKIIFIVYLSLFITLSAYGKQNKEIIISGDFNNTPFKEFVEIIERNYSIRFYYKDDWLKDIKISFSGSNIELTQVLNDLFNNSKLHFYIEGNSVFIYPGDYIISELPSFELPRISQEHNYLNNANDIEKKYFEGKNTSSIQILEVGDKRNSGNAKCIVNGRILDYSNAEPLIGATVYIEELKNGAVADLDGRFKLVLDPGKYKAVFSYMSMKQQEYYIQVYSSGSITIEMKKELISFDEVKITANRYDHIKGIQMGYERISAKTMKEIPVAFGERDVLKVAQMLPGVLNVGEGSAGFNVRGSAEDQNMFYINKIPVYNTSHLLGFFTSFNPDIINDFTFYKSNIPASYGGRLSSVFNITTRQGSKKKFYGQGGISPITAHSSIEIPLIKDKVSLVASFRSSYSDWLLKKIKNNDIKKSSAFFYDGSFSANAELNNRNLLKAFVYLSKDKFSLSSFNEYNYSNQGSSLSWKHIFSSTVAMDLAIVYSNYSFSNIDKSNLSTAYVQKYMIDHYEAREDFSITNNANHKIEFGASQIYYSLNRGRIIPYGIESNRMSVNLGKENGFEYAFYLSDEFSLFKNLTVLGGIRYSIFNQYGPGIINIYNSGIKTVENITETKEYGSGELIKSYSGPEYRLALNYILGENSSFKASYNRLFQYVFMLKNTIAISPDDKWKLCDYHITPPVADQISTGYYQNFKKGLLKASIEVYHKWIDNQVEYKDGTDFTSSLPIETQVLQGKQRVYGVEVMINKNSGKTTGWLSYCYSRSLVKVNGNLPENRINYGIEYPANYDRPHSINLVLNHKINRRLSYSANFVYTSGRPITIPISVYYSEGQQLLSYSKRNEYRIPDYARLDLSMNFEGNLFRKKPIHSSWSINLYNALARKNAYSIYFDSKDGIIQGHKMSIFGVPILTISWNYKFGNYLNE